MGRGKGGGGREREDQPRPPSSVAKELVVTAGNSPVQGDNREDLLAAIWVLDEGLFGLVKHEFILAGAHPRAVLQLLKWKIFCL